jgi:hypothetical protein
MDIQFILTYLNRRTAMKFPAIKLLVASMLVLAANSAFATTVHETFYTAPGTSAYLYFDYVPANGGAASVKVENFSTDGILGAVFSAPDVINAATGALPGTLTFGNSSTFGITDYLQGITFGNSFSFDVDYSAFTAGSSSFSLWVSSDKAGMNPLLTDSGLVLVTDLNSNNSISATNSAPVPEPSTVILMLFGLAGVIGYRMHKQKGLAVETLADAPVLVG